MPRPRGDTSNTFAVWLLLFELLEIGIDRIPPATLAALTTQAAIYVDVLDLLGLASLPPLEDVCVSAHHVWYRHDWHRLFLASVFHADDWHLYFNMTSFLSKAVTLERLFGSAGFLCLLGVFSVLVNMMLIALALFAEALSGDIGYANQCAVGFSGRQIILHNVSLVLFFGMGCSVIWVAGMFVFFLHDTIFVTMSSFISAFAVSHSYKRISNLCLAAVFFFSLVCPHLSFF